MAKTISAAALSVMFVVLALSNAGAQQVKTRYVDVFENVNHPQVAYWFFTDKMMAEQRYREKIDSFVRFGKYTLIFLTQRDNCDFYNAAVMHPVFSKLVAYAHDKGLKIALQIWKDDRGVKMENTDRLIQEMELPLDSQGKAACSVKPRGARNFNLLLKSGILGVYAFKKTDAGFYDPQSLKIITASARVTSDGNGLDIRIEGGAALAGQTAYILTQHYYRSCSNFSQQAKDIIVNAFKAYADIPFDGIGLDEYKNLTIARVPVLKAANDSFRERLYSEGMAAAMKTKYGMDLDRAMFDMRYAPEGQPEVRIRAINRYMALLRTATLGIETAMYDLSKKMYGKDAFIGLHNTFHNNLDRDEVWQTGASWWSIKRDYGHTDENTATPIQMGIGMSYPKNAMYNMYYDKSIDRIWTKALYDLRYGVRTHYHAANDVDGWGVSIDDPVALSQINKVENAARLLNRFDPPFPDIRLLVVYGMEALYNWYPDQRNRGMYDVNEKLDFEGKSNLLWNSGYLNASVPTDLIADGRLHLNKNGKPELNGHIFDAVILLGPEYARRSTLKFMEDYVNHGGRLLIEGDAQYDFDGADARNIWKKIRAKAIAQSFSLENAAKLGIEKNTLHDGVSNGNGQFTFASIEPVRKNQAAEFSFEYKGNKFSGKYNGVAVIKVNDKGELERLAATGFSSFSKNGKELMHASEASDVFMTRHQNLFDVTIADPEHKARLILNSK